MRYQFYVTESFVTEERRIKEKTQAIENNIADKIEQTFIELPYLVAKGTKLDLTTFIDDFGFNTQERKVAIRLSKFYFVVTEIYIHKTFIELWLEEEA